MNMITDVRDSFIDFFITNQEYFQNKIPYQYHSVKSEYIPQPSATVEG